MQQEGQVWEASRLGFRLSFALLGLQVLFREFYSQFLEQQSFNYR